MDDLDLEDEGKKIKCLGKDCTQTGYYKYGVCKACRPMCTICDKPIFAPLGIMKHKKCQDRVAREGVGEFHGVKHAADHTPLPL